MSSSFPITDSEPPRLTPAVQWLIAINVAIYFLQLTVIGSANMELALGFSSDRLSTAWWTVGTYMFVHGGFWHLALNMYTLYLFGPRVEHEWNGNEFTRYYLLCGLGGWFFHLLFVQHALLVGASAAVLGVALAYAMRWPNDEVYLFGVFPLKVKWMVALFAGCNMIAGIMGGDQGSGIAYMAHVGGLAAGWIYLRSSSAPGIDKLRQRVSQTPDVPDEAPRAIPRSLPRHQREKMNEIDEVISRSNAATTRRPALAPPPPGRGAREGDEATTLDHLLDKISQDGIDSLTSEERRLLEEKSKELRKD